MFVNMPFSPEQKKYIIQCFFEKECNADIARDFVEKFNVECNIESLRKRISKLRISLNIDSEPKPIKRLFFDIETGYHTVRSWRIGYNLNIQPESIIKEKKIICISYKWQDEDVVHTLTWDKNQSEKEMLKEFVSILDESSEAIGHNSDRFDLREIRTRCIANGILMQPKYRTLDTLKKSRSHFSFASNKLDYIGEFLNCGKKLKHEGYSLWIKVVEDNDRNALKDMVAYCERDVILLEDAYHVLSPYISHNTNFSVHNDITNKWGCPECASNNIILQGTDITPTGMIKRKMRCKECDKQYSISNKNYQNMISKINEM